MLHEEIRLFNTGRNRHFVGSPSDAELLRRFDDIRASKPDSEWDSDDLQLEAFAIEYHNFHRLGVPTPPQGVEHGLGSTGTAGTRTKPDGR